VTGARPAASSHPVRVVRALLVALLASLAAAPAATADVTVSGTLTTPDRLTAATDQVLYYLQLHAGATEERFSVRLTPPAFATSGGRDEGETVDGPLAVALQGPGTLGEQVVDGRFAAPCSAGADRLHGYATGAATVDVLLPPNAGTTLAVRYRTGRSRPWVDTDARLTFAVRPALAGTYTAPSPFAAGPTAVTPRTVRTAGPAVGGRLAAHVVLGSSPAGTVGPVDRAAKRIGRRTGVRVTGRVLPAVADRRVVLTWTRNGGAAHALATVRTDRRGRFAAPRWAPGRSGDYEVWARYPTQAGSLAGDGTSCPVRFRAR
jgi:hypothetical protein